MPCPGRLALLGALLLTGCTATRNAAISTFRVLDTPHRLIRERLAGSETTTTTTTTETSDVVNPGQPIVERRAPSAPRQVTAERRVNPPASAARSSRPPEVTPRPKPRPSATPRPSAAQTTQFPTAKPVPGRPGYVYSIDPKGGIVDVTGYKSGDKAKDPYTKQVFIVP